MGIGQPGVHRPHRHLHRKAGEEGQPQPFLRCGIEIIGHQGRDIGGASIIRHPQHGDQHQHRSEQSVEEELVAGVNPVGPAPHADDQVHRDQPGFKEDVEQEQILRGKHADNQQFHEQERRHIFTNALLDREPRCADAHRHQEHRQRNQQQGDAINAELPAEPGEQRQVLLKLPLRPADVELAPQDHTERKVGQRGGQGNLPRGADIGEQAGDGPGQRHQHHQAEDGEVLHCVIPPSPRSPRQPAPAA